NLAIDVSPQALDPGGDLYAVIGAQLWRSTDGAASWKALGVPAAPPACAAMASGAILCGGYRSIDHGETWAEMEFIGGNYPGAFAGTGPVVYAIASGYPWHSEDDGVSWVRGALVNISATNLAVGKDGAVYHGTKRSFDKGANWQEIGHRVSYVDQD